MEKGSVPEGREGDGVTDAGPDGGAASGPVVSLADRCRGSRVGDAVLDAVGADLGDVSDAVLLADAEGLLAAQQVLAAAVQRTVGAAIARGLHHHDGSLSARAWIARVAQIQLFQTFVTLAVAALLLNEAVGPETVGFALAVAFVVWLGRKAKIARAVPAGSRA